MILTSSHPNPLSVDEIQLQDEYVLPLASFCVNLSHMLDKIREKWMPAYASTLRLYDKFCCKPRLGSYRVQPHKDDLCIADTMDLLEFRFIQSQWIWRSTLGSYIWNQFLLSVVDFVRQVEHRTCWNLTELGIFLRKPHDKQSHNVRSVWETTLSRTLFRLVLQLSLLGTCAWTACSTFSTLIVHATSTCDKWFLFERKINEDDSQHANITSELFSTFLIFFRFYDDAKLKKLMCDICFAKRFGSSSCSDTLNECLFLMRNMLKPGQNCGVPIPSHATTSNVLHDELPQNKPFRKMDRLTKSAKNCARSFVRFQMEIRGVFPRATLRN